MKARALSMIVVFAACSSNPEPTPTPTPTPTTTPTPAPAPAVAPPPATSAFDPVGSYDLTIEAMGQSQTGTMNITKADGKLGGSLVGPDGNSLSLGDVKLDGRKMTLSAQIPNGPVLTFALEFATNDACKGTFEIPGMGQGGVSCTRKKS